MRWPRPTQAGAPQGWAQRPLGGRGALVRCILCSFFNEMQCLGNARGIWLCPGNRSGSYSGMTWKVPEEGSYGLTEDGPPSSGVPLPRVTSQLYPPQKGLPVRGCPDCRSQQPSSSSRTKGVGGARPCPPQARPRGGRRPRQPRPGATKEVVAWQSSKWHPSLPRSPSTSWGDSSGQADEDAQTSGPVLRQMAGRVWV